MREITTTAVVLTVVVADRVPQRSGVDVAVNETARRQALEDLIAWAVDHDPVTLEVEREDAWRNDTAILEKSSA